MYIGTLPALDEVSSQRIENLVDFFSYLCDGEGLDQLDNLFSGSHYTHIQLAYLQYIYSSSTGMVNLTSSMCMAVSFAKALTNSSSISFSSGLSAVSWGSVLVT